VKNQSNMNKIYAYLIILLATISCKEKYISPVVSPTTGYLVIEGIVNNGQGKTTIKLSRTTPLDNTQTQYEKNADVKLEGEDKTIFSFIEQGFGQYAADSLHLNAAIKYRLAIKTSNGSAYLSDFVKVKNNPPIDSVAWVRNTEGVQLTINTHDTQNNTRYYLWDYVETWAYHSDFKSYLQYEIKTSPTGVKTYSTVYRDLQKGTFDSTQYFCWQTAKSTNILLGTTAKLDKDIVNLPLALIPKASIKLNIRYSILVKQYSLSPEAYAFLDIMKKNTEQTGSIFDAQPSGVYGNIYNIRDANEPVIGYLIICPIQEKRIFIDNIDLPRWDYRSTCTETLFRNSSNTIRDLALGYVPTAVPPGSAPFPTVVTFNAAPIECVNCQISGTHTKPDFWR
jgi:hypothetical protein